MTDLTEDDIALAGEYVLGTLAHEQRQDAARRLVTDPAFAREVEAWETRLDPMLADLAPLSPPAALWKRIDAQLFAPSRAASPWRWLAAASAFSTAILAAVLWFGQPVSGPPGPLWVSNMVSDSGEVRLTALYDAGRTLSRTEDGEQLTGMLKKTALSTLVYSLLLAMGLALA